MSAVKHPAVPQHHAAPVVRITDRPIVCRGPRPIRSTTEPRTFHCASRFDACLESGACAFPGRCENGQAA